ncbi:Calcitonin gene-related peptide type 1 receptor, partial [Acipenser ruthenus]
FQLFVFANTDANETQHSPQHVYSELGVTRNKIVTAQFECYQKIMKDTDYNKKGPLCNRTWDGWLCWDDTPAGMTSVQRCPDYFQDFDPSVAATQKGIDKESKKISTESEMKQAPDVTRDSLHYHKQDDDTHCKSKFEVQHPGPDISTSQRRGLRFSASLQRVMSGFQERRREKGDTQGLKIS